MKGFSKLPLPALLDGATGTNLLLAGMPSGCSVEQWVYEDPAPLKELQAAFCSAGSNIVYAPTFSANRIKLSHFGLEDSVYRLNTSLVGITRSAVGNNVLVGGDMSPTGLFCEPLGDVSFDELCDIYYEQACALRDGGADLIAAETFFSLSEARAALTAAKKTGLDVFVTLTVDKNGRTLTGGDMLSALLCLQSMGASAFGMNCSVGPESMLPIVERLAPYADIPLIVKPNAGLPDAAGNEKLLPPEEFALQVRKLLCAGASLIGGCCGSTPAHISALRGLLDSFDPSSLPPVQKPVHLLTLCSEGRVYFFDDEPEISPAVDCSPDMEEALLDMCDEDYDIIRINLTRDEDSRYLIKNSSVLSLPICFSSDDPAALEAGLRRWCGIAAVDKHCADELPAIAEAASHYGAPLI